MTTASRRAEIEAAIAFLAEDKTLDGPPPIWGEGAYATEYSANWIILDSIDAPAGELRFVARRANPSICSINVVYKSRPLWRVDMDDPGTCHSNPLGGHLLGLPGVVCGNHEHAWPLNVDRILRQDEWSLGYRRPLPPTIRRLGQALLWLADQINLTISPEQRGFDGPTRSDLFQGGGQ